MLLAERRPYSSTAHPSHRTYSPAFDTSWTASANSVDQALADARAELAAVNAAHARELSASIARAEIAEKELEVQKEKNKAESYAGDLAEITLKGYKANEVRDAMEQVWNFDVDKDGRISATVVHLHAMRNASSLAKAKRRRITSSCSASAATLTYTSTATPRQSRLLQGVCCP